MTKVSDSAKKNIVRGILNMIKLSTDALKSKANAHMTAEEKKRARMYIKGLRMALEIARLTPKDGVIDMLATKP